MAAELGELIQNCPEEYTVDNNKRTDIGTSRRISIKCPLTETGTAVIQIKVNEDGIISKNCLTQWEGRCKSEKPIPEED